MNYSADEFIRSGRTRCCFLCLRDRTTLPFYLDDELAQWMERSKQIEVCEKCIRKGNSYLSDRLSKWVAIRVTSLKQPDMFSGMQHLPEGVAHAVRKLLKILHGLPPVMRARQRPLNQLFSDEPSVN